MEIKSNQIHTSPDLAYNPFLHIDSRLKKIEELINQLNPFQSVIALPQLKEAETILSIKELAEQKNVSIQTIHNWKKEGLIPFYRIGRNVFFKLSEVDRIARVAAVGEKKKGSSHEK